ncbi:hypothetical protein CWS72_16500 [Telmatospirillum siberiense]|uniref:DUF1841 domain-containing protein n=2 Tax=Telmatospirillum siberiense TaxID=382514 RepID=A0A2N3PSW7_9PROT|nr:hypothetical protein CWS72_16500 [Telmatospirillum siberiense]
MPDFGGGAAPGADASDLDGENYNPAEAPDPKEWLALDEQERQILVENFHRRAGVRPPNETVHAIFHVIVENQIAEGDDLPVRRAVERLIDGGLDRHEALHAVGSVLSDFMYDILQGKETKAFPQDAYNAAVERLTVESWRQQAKPEAPAKKRGKPR